MIRYLVVGIASVVLFFPAYWALHPLLGADWGAGIAAGLMYLGFPALMLRVWKTYPPLGAVPIDPGDPTMAPYTERAMREFDRFKRGLAEGRKDAFVKYVVAAQGGGKEHVWGVAHAIEGDDVIVSMESEPVQRLEPNSTHGLRARVPITALEDWMLVSSDGKCEGGYTNLGLAKVYSRLYGKVPKKYLRQLEHFIDIEPSEYLSL